MNTNLCPSGLTRRALRTTRPLHTTRVARLALPLATLLACRSAAASERHFGFTYESSVLNPGTAELEPWTTVRAGHVDYYSRVDGRVAFEYGLLKNLQGAFFWNFSSVAEDILLPGAPQSTRLTDTEFQSFSAQLKYKFSDPVADALGSGLYLEGTFGPLVAGVEGRLILDKQVGSLLFALNLVGDGVEQLNKNSTFEGTFSGIASAGYFVTPTFVPGLEIREESGFSAELERSVLYLGPSLSLSTEGFWGTLALEPQITAFKGASPGHHLDLDQNERLQARLLFGFHL